MISVLEALQAHGWGGDAHGFSFSGYFCMLGRYMKPWQHKIVVEALGGMSSAAEF